MAIIIILFEVKLLQPQQCRDQLFSFLISFFTKFSKVDKHVHANFIIIK